MSNTPAPRKSRGRWLFGILVVACAAALFVWPTSAQWLRGMLVRISAAPATGSVHADEHGHEHGHAHEAVESIELSEQARKNIGLELMKVALGPFERTIDVPGIVVERPGRSNIQVTASMNGVVTRVYPIQGQAVLPGEPLFDVRLTHEDLVQSQTELLRTAEQLDVIGREIVRLEKVSADGAIAGKTLLERKYDLQMQQATQRAQRQALLLHGLNDAQVETILKERKLLQMLTISAPLVEGDSQATAPPVLQVEEIKVDPGQSVTAGTPLAILANHAELHLEGSAFEQDVEAIHRAAGKDWSVAALLESQSRQPEVIHGLKILYLSNRVDAATRAYHFYVTFPNELLRESRTPDGRRLVYWRYKPGQRAHILVPVERWTDRIVLPATAIAQEGPESYVFVPNGDHFQRRPVHVEFMDQLSAVIEPDGSLYPGETVAKTGAHQLQLAIKNKSGGAIDPHAGHNH